MVGWSESRIEVGVVEASKVIDVVVIVAPGALVAAALVVAAAVTEVTDVEAATSTVEFGTEDAGAAPPPLDPQLATVTAAAASPIARLHDLKSSFTLSPQSRQPRQTRSARAAIRMEAIGARVPKTRGRPHP